MKILVTGGAGFIGSHIVDACLERGHNVVIVDNFTTGRRENVNPNATLIEADIQDPSLETVFQNERFDRVCHQAAQMDVRLSVKDPIFDAQNNILGFINILQQSVKTGVKKVVFASSGGAIYGEQDTFPADETHRLQPYSPYGITKMTGEKYLFFYRLNYDLNYVALRYANVYGPRQNPNGEAGVVAIFTQKMLEGNDPVINGPGTQTRDFVFVDDVVRANILALEGENCDIFNVGTGRETTVNEIFRHLLDFTGSQTQETHGAAQPGEQQRSVIDYQKIKSQMGWRPQVTLADGLKRTVEYFRAQQ